MLLYSLILQRAEINFPKELSNLPRPVERAVENHRIFLCIYLLKVLVSNFLLHIYLPFLAFVLGVEQVPRPPLSPFPFLLLLLAAAAVEEPGARARGGFESPEKHHRYPQK